MNNVLGIRSKFISMLTGDTWIKELVSNTAHSRKLELAGLAYGFAEIRLENDNYASLPINQVALGLFLSTDIMVYSLGSQLLRVKGYQLELNTTGKRKFSGHNVLKLAKPDPLPGIKYPDDYKILKPITLSSSDGSLLCNELNILFASLWLAIENSYDGEINKIEEVFSNKMRKEAIKLLSDLEAPKPSLDKDGNPNDPDDIEFSDYKKAQKFKKIQGRFSSMWNNFDSFNSRTNAIANILFEDKKAFQTEMIDLSGKGGAKRFIPKLEWFSDKIKNEVTPEKLLLLFPKAEREVFEYFIGRTASGRLEQKLTDGFQNKNWRTMPILIQKKGGLGKSKTVGLMDKTLQFLGYSTATLPPDLTGRFGFLDLARSDFGYVDDMEKDKVASSITNHALKSLVSNSDNFSGEKKGQDHVKVSSTSCTVLLITNEFPTYKLDLDGGNISRIAPMKLYTEDDQIAKDLAALHNLPIAMDLAWEELAERCGLDPSEEGLGRKTLMSYLIRLCVDKYQKLTSTTELVSELNRLVSEFRINLKIDHQKSMMMHYLLIAKRGGLKLEAFESDHFLRTLWFSVNRNSTVDYPWNPEIPECATTPAQINIQLEALFNCKKAAKIRFKEFMEQISSKSGFNYSIHINQWVELFNECIGQIEGYSEGGEEKYMQHYLDLAAHDVEKLLGRLEKVEYDPARHSFDIIQSRAGISSQILSFSGR